MVKLFLKLFDAKLYFIIKDNRKYIFILLILQLRAVFSSKLVVGRIRA
jgi:hypothetical protein